ncbi:MAG: hypothetical protein AAF587_02065 [Bacteroidota bacterium]
MPYFDHEPKLPSSFPHPYGPVPSSFPDVSHLQQGKGSGKLPMNNGSLVAASQGGVSMIPPALDMQASPVKQETIDALVAKLKEPSSHATNWGENGSNTMNPNFEQYTPPESYQGNSASKPTFELYKPQEKQQGGGGGLTSELFDYLSIVTGDKEGKKSLLDIEGDEGNLKLLYADNQEGEFEEDGKTHYGQKKETGFLKGELDIAKIFGLDKNNVIFKAKGGVMTSEEHAYHQEEESVLSATMNYLSGELEMGTSNPDSKQDEVVSIGKSEGKGGGVKFVQHDNDGDGQKSYGISLGLPNKPSVGFESEDPLKTLSGPAADLLLPEDMNLTNETSDLVEDIYNYF